MYFSDRAFKTGAFGLLISLFLYFIILLVCGAATVGLQRFTAILFSEKILFAIKLSIFTATVSTILSMIVAVPASFALSRFQFRGKGIIDTLLDVPIILSPIAIGAMLLIFFNTATGRTVEKFTIPFVFEVPGIILAQFTVVCALAVRLLKSTFDSIDTRYEKVSRTLGLSSSATFFRVLLPLAKNGLIASAILTWARAIGEFGATVTLAGAMPMKTETLPVAIYLSFANADIERAMAVVFILVAMALAVLLLIRKLTAEKTT